MSKEKEETGFGFKDGAKARETIELLKKHDLNYQRLTVRGLLGRAKRVLTMTKAEEKVKNIKEAIEIFEKWVEEHKAEPKAGKTAKSPEKKEQKNNKDDNRMDEDEEKDSAKSDTVQGLGFKDKDKALETIKVLEGRDPDYQKLAVKGLIGRAKRVLTSTRDESKIKSIKDAISVFDDFLDKFERMGLAAKNLKYLASEVVVELTSSAKEVSDKQKRFASAYSKVGGDYKKLRTVEDGDSEISWDIIRNKELDTLIEKHKSKDLFDSDGHPTEEHLQQILWAYSPRPDKLKQVETNSKKRKSDGDEVAAKKAKA